MHYQFEAFLRGKTLINSVALFMYTSVSLSAGGSFNFMDFLYCQYSLYTILGMLNPAIFLVFISILKTAFNWRRHKIMLGSFL